MCSVDAFTIVFAGQRLTPFFPQGRAAAVQTHLLAQTLAAARRLAAALVEAGAVSETTAQNAPLPRPTGLAAVVGGGGSSHATAPPPPSSTTTLADVAPHFATRHGFSLAVRPSSVPAAGDGVFVCAASTRSPLPPGTLAALYPGTAYSPLQMRALAGYPRVDAGSDYLAARYDGVVLDGVAWGLAGGGAPRRPRPDGAATPTGDAAAAEAALGTGVDSRHPLAVGHLVNHPPPGAPPNVALAAVDVPLSALDGPSSSLLRRCIPVVPVGGPGARPPDAPLPCLALVALTPLSPGDELFLNYRLSSRVARPGWYVPVDDDEDARRWA